MSTSQVAFYTNRVGKIPKHVESVTDKQTKPGSDNTYAHLLHLYSRTPTRKLVTAHLRCTVTNKIRDASRQEPADLTSCWEQGAVYY